MTLDDAPFGAFFVKMFGKAEGEYKQLAIKNARISVRLNFNHQITDPVSWHSRHNQET